MKQLLLLHGAIASSMQFNTLLPLLKNDFDARAIHFSGHGGLPIPGDGYTFPNFANDILQFADEHKIDKLNIFGYSMGGYAALYFARLYPDRVNKLVTLNTKFKWDAESTAKETGLLDPDKMTQKIPAFAEHLMQQHGKNNWVDVVKETARMMHQLSQNSVLGNEDFKQIETPALLMVGDRDKTSSIEENAEVFRTLPNAQMQVLPNTPHPFDRVDHIRLADDLKRFFN